MSAGRGWRGVVLAVLSAVSFHAAAGGAEPGPRLLVVTAHPDDESEFAGVVYKTVHSLGGSADLAVITDGGGGFHYAALAEPIYRLELTDERVGRANLPRIRQRELLAAGDVLGIRAFHFLDQPDLGYTQDARAVLDEQWDLEAVDAQLRYLLRRWRYDVVLVPLPTPTTHGAHQAAAIVTLAAVAQLPTAERPAVLGGTSGGRAAPRPAFSGQPAFPATRVPAERPVLVFDRSERVDREAGLDYRAIVDWVMAAHKSQGRSQGPAEDELELYYEFAQDDAPALARAEAFFGRLAAPAGPSSAADHPPRWYGVCPVEP